MNVGLWWKANLKGSGLLPGPQSGHATTNELFAHLLLQEDLDCNYDLISSSFHYLEPFNKISLQSIYNFLSNIAYTERHTKDTICMSL